MKLTGKTKTEFEEWYNHKYFPIDQNATAGYAISTINKGSISLARFWHLPPEMQWGVYVDFFDSVNIKITIGFYGYSLEIESEIRHKKSESRIEARKQAIEKANEIYNSAQ